MGRSVVGGSVGRRSAGRSAGLSSVVAPPAGRSVSHRSVRRFVCWSVVGRRSAGWPAGHRSIGPSVHPTVAVGRSERSCLDRRSVRRSRAIGRSADRSVRRSTSWRAIACFRSQLPRQYAMVAEISATHAMVAVSFLDNICDGPSFRSGRAMVASSSKYGHTLVVAIAAISATCESAICERWCLRK